MMSASAMVVGCSKKDTATGPKPSPAASKDSEDGGGGNAGENDVAAAARDAAAVTSKDSGKDANRTPAPSTCAGFLPAQLAGKISNDKLDEISGLAASVDHPGVFWGHNDSGEKKARLYAINEKARHIATFKLKGVAPIDWEDIAVGPCAASGAMAKLSCIYVGDIGDNSNKRDYVMVHRVAEPASLPTAPAGDAPRRERFRKNDTETFTIRYPKAPGLRGKDQKREEHPDVEAMVVLPDTRVVLISKRGDGTGRVFRATLSGPDVTAEALGALDFRDKTVKSGVSLRATAADLSKDGRWLLVRSYFRIFRFDVDGVLTAKPADAAAKLPIAPRETLLGGLDLQGESIAWGHKNDFWHTSEGKHAPLWHIRCAKP